MTDFPMSLRKGVTAGSHMETLLKGVAPIYDTIHRARLYIEEHGWAQGDLVVDGRVCTVGAVREAHKAARPGGLIPFQALMLIAEVIGCDVEQIDSWNDEPGRTKEQVLVVLEAAEQLALERYPDEERLSGPVPSVEDQVEKILSGVTES